MRAWPRFWFFIIRSTGTSKRWPKRSAEGARGAGATVDIKRVPETVPEEIARAHHFKLDQAAPVATVDELPQYDAIIVGVGTRYGRMPAQMASFLDQTGGLWMRGALNGKVGAAFAATASQHGGQEDHAVLGDHQPAASGAGGGGAAVFVPGAAEAG